MSKRDLLNKYAELRQPTLIFSRVMGYLTCRDRYNDSKKQEAAERVYFEEGICCSHCGRVA